MKWNIITDSSCDLSTLNFECDDTALTNVPFVISADNKEFVDDKNLNTLEMMNIITKSSETGTTSCPSPYAWYEKFDTDGYIIAITISKGLSGSYNSAQTAKNMILDEYPERKIAIIDSCSSGPASAMTVRKVCELIKKAESFENVVEQTEKYIKNLHTVFALCSFKNLVKNGRISKFAGQIANVLNFWGIGISSEEGTIKVKEKVRGEKRVILAIIEEIKEKHLADNKIVISHCHNAEFAEKIKNGIKKVWDCAEITIMQTKGLNSYYADLGGVIISY